MNVRATLLPPLFFGLLAVALAGGPILAQATPPSATPPPRPSAVPPTAPTEAELAGPPATAAKLPSGIVTRQLRAGSGGVSPRKGDIVIFRAIGRRRDGSVVQDSFGRPEPTKILLSKLHPAWQEALSGMITGEQRRFWFPAALGPKDQRSGVQEPIVFDLELERVVRMPEPPTSLAAPDSRARKVGAGTSVLTVQSGSPGPKTTRTDGAMVEYTLWNPTGEPLGSTASDGRPTLFPIERVMPSFADCLLEMSIGERRLCWIPALLNTGFPGAASGDLIFQVELKSIVDMSKLMGSTPKPGKG